MRIAADQQLAPIVTCRATDQRVVGKHIQCADDLVHAVVGRLVLVLMQVVDDPVQILD